MNYYKIVFSVMMVFLIGCEEKPNNEINNFEESAIEFLQNKVLIEPLRYKAIEREPFFKKYFNEVEFKGKKVYVYDSICHWSYEITSVERPTNLKPFPCYTFLHADPNDITSISREDFEKKKNSYLIVVFRPIKYDKGQYIMLGLYPSSEKEQTLLFFITMNNNELKLTEIGTGTDLKSLYYFD